MQCSDAENEADSGRACKSEKGRALSRIAGEAKKGPLCFSAAGSLLRPGRETRRRVVRMRHARPGADSRFKTHLPGAAEFRKFLRTASRAGRSGYAAPLQIQAHIQRNAMLKEIFFIFVTDIFA